MTTFVGTADGIRALIRTDPGLSIPHPAA